MMRKLAGLMLAAFALTAPAPAQDSVPEPDGYRTENYRAPVPATLAGARVLATAEAEAVWRAGTAVFVGLPDTGYGALAAATEDYLRGGLARAAGNSNAKLLVIYCQADCWMSWNAAKRVLSYGYRNVAWYPLGTDGWEAANLPVAESQPEPRPDQENSSSR